MKLSLLRVAGGVFWASIVLCAVGTGLAAAEAAKPFFGRAPIVPRLPVEVPRHLEAMTEPQTGLEVSRMTDGSAMIPPTKRALIVYSRFSPVNTSGRYFIAHGENSTSACVFRVEDGGLVASLRYDDNPSHTLGEVNEIRWDYSGEHPDRVYFVRGMNFYRMELTENGRPVLIRDFGRDFPEGVKIVNDVEGDSSCDSNRWAWMVKGKYSAGRFPTLAIFSYDREVDRILGVLSPQGGAAELPTPNMVEVSPSGKKVITHYGRCWGGNVLLKGQWRPEGEGEWSLPYRKAISGNSVINAVTVKGELLPKSRQGATEPGWRTAPESDRLYLRLAGGASPVAHPVEVNYGSRSEQAQTPFDGPHAWDPDFTRPVKVSVGETHSGWAYDQAGREWFVSQNNRTDWIEARDPATGKAMKLIAHADIGWGNGFHIGKFYRKEHAGWCLVSTYSKGNAAWGDNQIFMIQLKPAEQNPLVWRITPTYNRYGGKYRDEAPAALAHDGKSVWWSANWGWEDGKSEVYRVALPATWPQELATEAKRIERLGSAAGKDRRRR